MVLTIATGQPFLNQVYVILQNYVLEMLFAYFMKLAPHSTTIIIETGYLHTRDPKFQQPNIIIYIFIY